MINGNTNSESAVMKNDFLNALQSIKDTGFMDADWKDIVEKIDVSTGIGMLAALAKLNLVVSGTNVSGTRGDGKNWRPSFINTIAKAQHKPEDYVVADNNRALFDLLSIKVAKDKKNRGELFFIKGKPGVGKTHLLTAVAEKATRKACVINVGEMELELERVMKRKERAELYQWILSFDVLLIDDVQHVKDNTFLQKEIRRLIIYHIDRGNKVILTGDTDPSGMKTYESALSSLFEFATVLTLELPDESARRKILDVYYQDDIPDDAAEYLAANVSKNLRQLLGAAIQLINLHHQTDTPINKDMARAVLPLPSDLRHPTSLLPNAVNLATGKDEKKERSDRAGFFREILSSAENEEEQALALQIALGQRLRELREQEKSGEDVVKMEMALSLLREGQLEEAIKCIG